MDRLLSAFLFTGSNRLWVFWLPQGKPHGFINSVFSPMETWHWTKTPNKSHSLKSSEFSLWSCSWVLIHKRSHVIPFTGLGKCFLYLTSSSTLFPFLLCFLRLAFLFSKSHPPSSLRFVQLLVLPPGTLSLQIFSWLTSHPSSLCQTPLLQRDFSWHSPPGPPGWGCQSPNSISFTFISCFVFNTLIVLLSTFSPTM